MSELTTKDWREFHYGKEKPKPTVWRLQTRTGNSLAEGTYAHCVYIRQQKESVDPTLKQPKYKLEIVPVK